MHCGNCGKEIGTNLECNFCGYDPKKDGAGAAVYDNGENVTVPPVNIVLKKKKNKMAVAGFVLGLISWILPCWILSVIFSLVGFFRAKLYRSGRVLAILGLVFCALVLCCFIVVISGLA